MKKIGLIGGMSWESSALYYQLINEEVRRRVGGLHSASCVMGSVDFAEIERMQVAGEWEKAGDVLAQEARDLVAAGATFLVLCTNTMHKVAAQIEAAVDVPLLHLVDVTAQAILDAGLTKVALLGTRFTMEQSFYRDRMHSHGVETLVPDPDDRAVVNDVIYDELVLGIVRDTSRDAYRRIIARLAEQGAEGVILGCTEIEMLISQGDTTLPVFPSTRLHALAAVGLSLAAS